MATDVSRVDRLLRKRNRCLQHQLNLRVQIMDKELKLSKNRVNREIYDCNSFYQTIQGVYPGLEKYSVPDTKSMFMHNKQMKKERAASAKSSDVSRYRGSHMGDSRHIARAGQTQIQPSIYSTFVQSEKENCPSPQIDSVKPTKHIADLVLQLEEERRLSNVVLENAKADHGQPWRRSNTSLAATPVYGSKESIQPSTDDEGEKIPEYEHPIATLVRTMRERIYSAPPTRKVQFHQLSDNVTSSERPKTAYRCPADPSSDVNNPSSSNQQKSFLLSPRKIRPSSTSCAKDSPSARKPPSQPNSHKLRAASAKPDCNHVTTSRRTKNSRPLSRQNSRNQLSRPNEMNSNSELPPGESGLASEKAAWVEFTKKRSKKHEADDDYFRRPKSAPPSYELLGKSPALPRQQVAGIMAEMESRRAATRCILDKSRLIQNQVRKITIAQGIQSDEEDEDEAE